MNLRHSSRRPSLLTHAAGVALLAGAGAIAAAPLAAQCYTSPDNAPASGGCNVIPFGDANPTSTTWSNQVYQMLVTAADLNNQAGLVTTLSFAPCGTGLRQATRITVKMGHCNLGTMTTTFANNFTTPAQTVLDVRDFHWPNTANVWNRIPLETPFVYVPPLGDLLIEVHTEGIGMPGGTNGMHTGGRPRLYAFSWSGTPPATGSLGTTAALKVEVCMGTAGTATFGVGCKTSGSAAAKLDYTGSSQLGQKLSIDVSGAAGAGAYLMMFGTTIAPPLPLQLDALGMPGCRLYTNSLITIGGATTGGGAGSTVVPIPNMTALTGLILFNQAVLLDATANKAGYVASNGGQFVVGS